MKIRNIFGHLKNIFVHKWWVFYYCCKFRIPWRGFMHDWSKLHPTEFFESVKFYKGDGSPIPIAKKEQGYSLAWQHHKGHNEHHYEYWTDNYDRDTNAQPMPLNCILEMIADWFAAGRTYKGKDFKIKDEVEWWENKKLNTPKINNATFKLIDYIFEQIEFFNSIAWMGEERNYKVLEYRYGCYKGEIVNDYVK